MLSSFQICSRFNYVIKRILSSHKSGSKPHLFQGVVVIKSLGHAISLDIAGLWCQWNFHRNAVSMEVWSVAQTVSMDNWCSTTSTIFLFNDYWLEFSASSFPIHFLQLFNFLLNLFLFLTKLSSVSFKCLPILEELYFNPIVYLIWRKMSKLWKWDF